MVLNKIKSLQGIDLNNIKCRIFYYHDKKLKDTLNNYIWKKVENPVYDQTSNQVRDLMLNELQR